MSYISGEGYLEFEPKTSRGMRKIVLPHFVCEVLKQHRSRQFEARSKAGSTAVRRNLEP
jgi:hypothetical protein